MLRRRRIPAKLPLLARGRHRRPSSGACIMEYVSVLAGERWSDHPRSVCPVLAAVARVVNDNVGDEARRALAPWAPEFIGTEDAGASVRFDLGRHLLVSAVEDAPDDDARFPLFVALSALDEASGMLRRSGAGDDPEAALVRWRYPALATRAQQFVRYIDVRPDRYLSHGLPAAAAMAVAVLADAHPRTRDDVLTRVLRAALDRYEPVRRVSGDPTRARLRH